ncbi:MAG: 4-hydroxy-tetrahydrodipicolinate synthase [Fimbriimonadaceae bacterium]|jgi:4-hydroxy-tetrahydrodipicolinate synthase|nr:4-hydroxy-tetrahydrodipicolinate synthase [Fimbriimonadaceae bacterium]
MLQPGVYPASVTPFDERGRVDMAAMARLLAWFEAAGCKGAVLAGTNGEGPSLSAIEKRDLVRDAMPLRGRLEIVLGIATSSLEEAVWLINQAEKAGAVAALVMPPSYFREASEEGILEWFRALMDRTYLPLLAYNLPQRTGITITAEMLKRLAEHERFAGAKDSSGVRENLAAYAAVKGKALYVGNETLLIDALEAGWTGTISGASNVMPYPLTQIVNDWTEGKPESAEAKFQIALSAIKLLRDQAQPSTNKALLRDIGVIPSGAVRLPLASLEPERATALRSELEAHVGPLDRQARITA